MECDGTTDLSLVKEERLSVMNSTNPRVVLRNYIAQNAIQAAEKGDFSEVGRPIKVFSFFFKIGLKSNREFTSVSQAFHGEVGQQLYHK